MYQALEIMDVRDYVDRRYGWCYIRPRCIQVFRSVKWALFFISMGALIQGIAVNGLLHYFIPTIERHFELSSTKSGFMSGSYDIASLICLIPITYYGGQKTASKPFYIGTGVMIMGLGSFLFALPAFLSGAYQSLSAGSPLCIQHQLQTNQEQDHDYAFHYILLVFGNFLHGVGACPLFTLGVTFLDENAPPNKASIYLGLYYMMAIIGPCIGYIGGGYLSNIYVDFPSPGALDLNPDNPNWVGCWWLGFIFCAVAAIIFAIPILGLPRDLKDDSSEAGIISESLISRQVVLFSHTPTLRGLPASILAVIRRLKFDFITCAGFCEGVVISGMGSFFPKILEQQLGSSLQTTATVLGAFAIPCALFGILIGGWIIKTYQLKLDQMILFCLLMIVLSMFTVIGLFFSCPPIKIAGFHVPYPGQSDENKSLISHCNKDCHCDIRYDPVCGADKITYISPCFAGCLSSEMIGRSVKYLKCKCVNISSEDEQYADHYPCPQKCAIFYVFVTLLCIYQVFSFSACIPALTATLRSVEQDFKSLAIGIQWIIARLLGTVPGPVIFGMLFDYACVMWSPHAHKGGVCLIYDRKLISLYLGSIVLTVKTIEATFFTIAYFVRSDLYY
ncbi:hypothetical protein O3M35_009922 [Rhynocoris fuscipes]|uniref:Solute carrier organic anion transporter family member n=1 Tax=Rhynocoris fuscipes TaxID=488301 RepID=A0AAW1D4N2_9HEMI